jgi:hypothetical protein
MSLWNHTPLNQQDVDHAEATRQKHELDGVNWGAFLRDTLNDHSEIYREAAEVATAICEANASSERAALEEIDRVANAPYLALLAAGRNVIAVEDDCGDLPDDALTREQFTEREMAWSELRTLCAHNGKGEK